MLIHCSGVEGCYCLPVISRSPFDTSRVTKRDGQWWIHHVFHVTNRALLQKWFFDSVLEYRRPTRQLLFESEALLDELMRDTDPELRRVQEVIRLARSVSSPQVLTDAEALGIAGELGQVTLDPSPANAKVDPLFRWKLHGALLDCNYEDIHSRWPRLSSLKVDQPALRGSIIFLLHYWAQMGRAERRLESSVQGERVDYHPDRCPEKVRGEVFVVPDDETILSFVHVFPAAAGISRTVVWKEFPATVYDVHPPSVLPLNPAGRRVDRTAVPFDVLAAAAGQGGSGS